MSNKKHCIYNWKESKWISVSMPHLLKEGIKLKYPYISKTIADEFLRSPAFRKTLGY